MQRIMSAEPIVTLSVARHGFTHAAQDAYAAGSLQWSQHAQLAIELT